ncbi:MAG TPA: hypothetical protein VMD76_01060 [Candidatus Sulfotelmatobacter sp.]|nr:hypothetical protein [Candidatus Sulfotelmatobacter sp.]
MKTLCPAFLSPSVVVLRVATALLLALITFAIHGAAQTSADSDHPATSIIVHSKFGGQIYGFDIDQKGTEGVLTEAAMLANGNIQAAVETFSQSTGEILKVVTQTQDQDDFITLGVVGTSVGLVEHEHSISLFDVQRTFDVIDPLSGNKLTSMWTPPVGTTHLIKEVSRNQGVINNAVFAYDNSDNFIPWVYSSDVAANTFGPVIHITDSLNFGSVVPPMAYNPKTNEAILGGGDGCFGCFPVIGVANLKNGTFTEFTGVGFGFVNGIAMDSADNIAVTTTEDDASVEFYDLNADTNFTVVLPNSGENQIFSGADVEFDPIHKLFLIAQPVSSSAPSGSTIYVYDTSGNLQETLNGFSFSNAFNVIGTYIGLNPSKRTGFVNGPSETVNELQGFSY